MDTSGFYKRIDEDENIFMLYAPNFVYAPGYQLVREQYPSYQYPTDGWYWFDNDDIARSTLGIPDNPLEEIL